MTASRMGSLLAGAAVLVWAAMAGAAEVSVQDAWAKATLPGQKVAGAYMTITSDARARLVGVESPAAKVAEVHEMRHEDGVMRMRRLDALDLPAGKAVKLAPGGFHIMLMDIREPLVAGQSVPLTLLIEADGKRQSVPVRASVRETGPSGGHDHH